MQTTSMLSKSQRYGIAATLATSTLAPLLARLESCRAAYGNDVTDAAIDFARSIDRHYGRRDGFVPRKVIKLCQ